MRRAVRAAIILRAQRADAQSVRPFKRDVRANVPFTPFHFGPGAAAHAVAPRYISFISFCVANVLTDIEPGYFMLRSAYPWHRFFHTFVGATLIASATVVIFITLRAVSRRILLPNHFDWQAIPTSAVAMGAFLGTYSHMLLDGLTHDDMRPFAPFSERTPWLHLLTPYQVELSCLIAGILGVGILMYRHVRSNQRLERP